MSIVENYNYHILQLTDFSVRRPHCGQAAFNRSVDPALGKFCRDPQRILDRISVRRTMRNDACALYAQQRRATVFGVVKALLEIGEGAAREQRAHLPRDGGLQAIPSMRCAPG